MFGTTYGASHDKALAHSDPYGKLEMAFAFDTRSYTPTLTACVLQTCQHPHGLLWQARLRRQSQLCGREMRQGRAQAPAYQNRKNMCGASWPTLMQATNNMSGLARLARTSIEHLSGGEEKQTASGRPEHPWARCGARSPARCGLRHARNSGARRALDGLFRRAQQSRRLFPLCRRLQGASLGNEGSKS